jgi:hypothetical protein
MTTIGYLESPYGRGGWITCHAGHLAIEWEAGHQIVTETVTPGELRRRLPAAEALHRRVEKVLVQGLDPSGV